MGPVSSAEERPILHESSPFRFKCHANLPCFTQCCRDVNIYLTPYDVLRLRARLGLGSSEFLARYTLHYPSKTTGLPVVQLAMDPATLYCKLVTDEGCSVYPDRPWACRMYPLDLTERAGEYQAIVSDQKCFGLKEAAPHTVEEWLAGQQVEPFLSMDEVLLSTLPPEVVAAVEMGPEVGELFYLAYDLDRFAAMLDGNRFRASHECNEETLHGGQPGLEALLRLALRYIRSQLDERAAAL